MKAPAGFFFTLLISIVTISTQAQQLTVPYKETTYGEPSYTRTYFLLQHTGKLQLVLTLQSAKNGELKVQLSAKGKASSSGKSLYLPPLISKITSLFFLKVAGRICHWFLSVTVIITLEVPCIPLQLLACILIDFGQLLFALT